MPFTLGLCLFFLFLALLAMIFAGVKGHQLKKATAEHAGKPGDAPTAAFGGKDHYGRRDYKSVDLVLAEARSERIFGRWVTVGCLAMSLVFLFVASVKEVSTKNVGIETSFGSTSGELSNGLHFTKPWIQVHEIDAAIQTDSYNDLKTCLKARIANQQTACVDVSIRWRIIPRQADALFRDYHSFSHVRDSLVTRELRTAINQKLSNYNPLNSIATSNNPSQGVRNPTLSQIASGVTKQMRLEIGDQIEVLNTFIPLITFDNQTQSRINQLQQQVALTRIAEQSQQTATEQAKANKDLAASVSHSPNVLVAQCMDTLSTMVKDNQAVPAGFSCWPGSNLAGVIAGPTTNAK